MVIVLFTKTAFDGKGLGIAIGQGHHDVALIEDGHDGGMVLEHGEGSLHARHGHCLDFPFEEACCRCYNFNVQFLIFSFHQFFSFGDGFIDGSDEAEGCFGVLIHFTVHDHIESADGFFDRYHGAFESGELFGDVEGL